MTLHEEEEEDESKLLSSRNDFDERDQDTGMWSVHQVRRFAPVIKSAEMIKKYFGWTDPSKPSRPDRV